MRTIGLAQICLAPFPLLILLAAHVLFRDSRHYAVLITAVSTAMILLAEGVALVVSRSILRTAPPRQRRHWMACLGAEMAGTLLVWCLLLAAVPADRPEMLFLVYPLWLLRLGTLVFGLAGDLGLFSLVGVVYFLVAVACAFFLPWMPVVFGGLIWFGATLEGALKVWTRAYPAPP
jgi:hypothetical protein